MEHAKLYLESKATPGALNYAGTLENKYFDSFADFIKFLKINDITDLCLSYGNIETTTQSEANKRGYSDFLNGITICPYQDEALQSSWNEGYNRADSDDFLMKQERAAELKAKDYDECGNYMGSTDEQF